MLNGNYQQKCRYKTTSVQSEWGLGVEGWEALLTLRVRTSIDYPEDTLRGLMCHSVQFSSIQSISRVRLFMTPRIIARQASLSIINSQSSLRLTSIESVMPLAISSSVVHFSSCPQSLPASESFPVSQLFAWGGQSTGVSALASFLPKNTQGWSPLEWTG